MLPSLILAAAFAADDPCTMPHGRDARVCSARVGYCFDADIDGQRAEPLKDSVLRAKLTEQVGSKAVCWALPKPTSGTIDVVLHGNENTAELGTLRKGCEIVVAGRDGPEVIGSGNPVAVARSALAFRTCRVAVERARTREALPQACLPAQVEGDPSEAGTDDGPDEQAPAPPAQDGRPPTVCPRRQGMTGCPRP